MSMLRRAPWREILLVTAVFASALIWMFTASALAIGLWQVLQGGVQH